MSDLFELDGERQMPPHGAPVMKWPREHWVPADVEWVAPGQRITFPDSPDPKSVAFWENSTGVWVLFT